MQMANSEVATAVSLLQQLHGELPARVAALNAVHGGGAPAEAQPVNGAAHVMAGKARAPDAAAAGSRSASPAAARPGGGESDGEATAHQQNMGAARQARCSISWDCNASSRAA